MTDGRVYFPAILGNDALKARLGKDVAEDHLSHAYIIEGAKGSGRHTVALSVAAAIECEMRKRTAQGDLFGAVAKRTVPCGECLSCRKILSGKSPDVKLIGLEDDRVTIGVETIRTLKEDMYTAPNDLSVKVYIIKDADLMTEQAQNAFLLSLEEPPEYVLFFLLCEGSVSLLETIRSRAPTLRTTRLDISQIESYLLSNDPRATELRDSSAEDWNTLLFVSDGRIGYALELLDAKARSNLFESRKDVKKLISLLLSSNRAAALGAIPDFGKKRQDVRSKLSLLQHALRDLLLLKKSENAPLCFYEDAEEALELSTRFTSHALLSLYDAASRAKDDLDENSNVRLTLTFMMQRAGPI